MAMSQNETWIAMLAASFFDNLCYTCDGEQQDSYVSWFPSMLETLTAPQNSYVSGLLFFVHAVEHPEVPGEQAILVARDVSFVSSVKCERP